MTEGFLTTGDGVRLWYADEGAGVPLVLCHGGPGLWDYLGDLATPLTGTARVIRWEQRGCGRSDPVGPYTVARSVQDMDELRQHLGLERWVVGGHSWGATLALRYALEHLRRTVGLVYLSGVGLGRDWHAAYHAEADRRRTRAQNERLAQLEGTDRGANLEREHRALAWLPDIALPDRARAWELAWGLASAPYQINRACNAALNAEARAWDEAELVERCTHLDVPAVILHGAGDPRPAAAVESLQAALPRCKTHVLTGAGHLPWIEQPGATTRAITDHLARVRSGPGPGR